RDQLFPNSRDESAAQAPKPNPIAHATDLYKRGKAAIAVAQLRRLPPTDPHYQEAQKLIAAWDKPAVAAPAAAAPLTPEAARHRADLLADARQASAQGTFLKAVDHFEAAGQLAKLEGADAEDLAKARHEIEPFAAQVYAFKQHEWEYALPTL